MPISFNMKRESSSEIEGIYRFVVEDAKEKIKAGGKYPYAEIRMRPIINGAKWNSSVFDRISSSPDATFRIHSFMDCVNAPNEPGKAGIAWFFNKAGWARFGMETGDDGVDRPKVIAYLTEAQAEKQLAKMAEKAGMDPDAMEFTTQRSSRPAPDPEEPPVRTRKKAAAAVAELDPPDDEDVPF